MHCATSFISLFVLRCVTHFCSMRPLKNEQYFYVSRNATLNTKKFRKILGYSIPVPSYGKESLRALNYRPLGIAICSVLAPVYPVF